MPLFNAKFVQFTTRKLTWPGANKKTSYSSTDQNMHLLAINSLCLSYLSHSSCVMRHSNNKHEHHKYHEPMALTVFYRYNGLFSFEIGTVMVPLLSHVFNSSFVSMSLFHNTLLCEHKSLKKQDIKERHSKSLWCRNLTNDEPFQNKWFVERRGVFHEAV